MCVDVYVCMIKYVCVDVYVCMIKYVCVCLCMYEYVFHGYVCVCVSTNVIQYSNRLITNMYVCVYTFFL
jgi:hypothetical protein